MDVFEHCFANLRFAVFEELSVERQDSLAGELWIQETHNCVQMLGQPLPVHDKEKV